VDSGTEVIMACCWNRPIRLPDTLAKRGSALNWLTYDLMGLIGLIILGLVIILVVRLLVIFIPAAVVSFIVWYLTGSTWWTGAAFLVVAALSILRKL